MRTMWKGSLRFGLVDIPVNLYKATEDHKISLRSLHEECNHPIQNKKWCPTCDRELESKETVRGYEYTPENYVTITDDDIDNLPLSTLRTIEILHFTDQENVNPIYYKKTYYLGPGEYGSKSYKLLYQAMEQTSKVAIAKVAFRTGEHLSVVHLYQNCLTMNLIHYPIEIRAVEGVPRMEKVRDAEVSEAELRLAIKLIEDMNGAFCDDYKSNYEEAIKELIERKIESKVMGQLTMAAKIEPDISLTGTSH